MIDVLYDGDSSFYKGTVRFLKRRDRKRRLHFTNIADRKFDARIFDKSPEELQQQIHAMLPDGRWVQGAEALRIIAAAIGLRPFAFASGLPLIRQATNFCYQCLASLLSRPAGNQTNSSSGSGLSSAA